MVKVQPCHVKHVKDASNWSNQKGQKPGAPFTKDWTGEYTGFRLSVNKQS